MDRFPEPRKKSNFGMKCIKYLLLLINVLYLIISFLMISGATTLKVMFGEYNYVLWYGSTIESLSSLWIATGCLLLAASIFGIFAASRESTLMINVYGLFLSLIFILQMATAITGFTLITKSNAIVNSALNSLMDGWYFPNSADTMNFVQRTFECCGNEGPLDWMSHGMYSTPNPYYNSYYNTQPRWYSTYEPATEVPTTEKPLGIKMPESCCSYGSSYDAINSICGTYFTDGCHAPVQEVLSKSVLTIGSSSLIIGIVQIFGVVSAFMLARSIRRSKTDRDILKWTTHQSMASDRPAYVDQVTTQERREGEVQQI